MNANGGDIRRFYSRTLAFIRGKLFFPPDCANKMDVRMKPMGPFVSHVIRETCGSSLSICLIFCLLMRAALSTLRRTSSSPERLFSLGSL